MESTRINELTARFAFSLQITERGAAAIERHMDDGMDREKRINLEDRIH
jgi:hypothetical protein